MKNQLALLRSHAIKPPGRLSEKAGLVPGSWVNSFVLARFTKNFPMTQHRLKWQKPSMRRIFAKVILLISQNTVGINAKSGSNSKRLTKALFGENQKSLKIWTGIMLSIATMVQPVLLSSVPPSLLPLPFSHSESSECSKSSRQETIYSEMPSRLE